MPRFEISRVEIITDPDDTVMMGDTRETGDSLPVIARSESVRVPEEEVTNTPPAETVEVILVRVTSELPVMVKAVELRDIWGPDLFEAPPIVTAEEMEEETSWVE